MEAQPLNLPCVPDYPGAICAVADARAPHIAVQPYLDPDMAIAASVPVVANCRGEFPALWVDGTLSWIATVRDGSGSEVIHGIVCNSPANSEPKDIYQTWTGLLDAWRQQNADITVLEDENARRRGLPTNRTDRMRSWRDQLWQIMRQGWCSLETIRDEVLTEDEVTGMGWVQDANTRCWHAPGVVLDLSTFSYARPDKDQAPNRIAIPSEQAIREARAQILKAAASGLSAQLTQDGPTADAPGFTYNHITIGTLTGDAKASANRMLAQSFAPTRVAVGAPTKSDPLPSRALAPPAAGPGLKVRP